MRLKAFYLLSKPGIVYGNVISAIAGYLLACSLRPDWLSFGGMIIGYALVIASASVFNNLYDRDIDRQMKRTKTRPSVTGAVSTKAAVIYGTASVVVGLLVLLTSANLLTTLIAAFGFVVYTTAYTMSKRRTHHSTLIGSISGAAPIVGGYVAFSNRIDVAALLIGLMMLVWQMPHFYAIAIYREADYKKAGVPVLSVVRGSRVTSYYMVFYSLLFLLASLLLYRFSQVGLIYLIVMGITSLGWFLINLSGLFTKAIVPWAKRSFFSSLAVMIIMSLAIGLR